MTHDSEQPEQEEAEHTNSDSPSAHALIVGVGAGASDRDRASLHLLLSRLEYDQRLALIVCISSMEELGDDALLEEITASTSLPVEFASDGTVIMPPHVYLVRSNMLVTLDHGVLRARSSPEPLGERGRIDSLLISIAEEYRQHAIGVILAGTGGDGTLGATVVKEQGGLTVAEGVADADHQSALIAGAASTITDYTLPADRIVACIADYSRHIGYFQGTRREEETRDEIAAQIGRIAAILRNKTGHDFHGYKHNTFMRRVQRRLQVTQHKNVEHYIEFLRNDQEEVQRLFNDMLIGVTRFFRDRKEFHFLEKEVIPKLFEGKSASDSVRVWVLGCSTGEEAYSLAILLREHMATLESVPQVQIFATDIDRRALVAARVGRYPEAVLRDVGPTRLARWFVPHGKTYCVAKELREICLFSEHNLIKDAPFSRLDLVSCRNLLIYLNANLQDSVFPLFHYSLQPNGFLFLGSSENVAHYSKLFEPLDPDLRIFRKIASTTRVRTDFPLSAASHSYRRRAKKQDFRLHSGTLTRRAVRIAERYAPAYVVVDDRFEVILFSGRTGRFLDPTAGAATLDLLNLVHRDLRPDLRKALHEAATENLPRKLTRLQMLNDGEITAVTILIEPVHGGAGDPPHFMILFQDGETIPRAGVELEGASPERPDEHIQRIETELRLTRERLQATIEELESTNEELKSSNEEHRSINEELQAANEELQTSKEELQSVNEELQTVNCELAHRVEELAKSNSDIRNLLQSTQIATIFLDNDLCINSFTPAVTEIFNLIDSDVGRPITHIAARIDYTDLAEDVARVLRTLTTIERHVEDNRSGARYLLRILPYRSIDNFIAGVVLTFLDVTAVARAEKALRESEERFRMMAQTVHDIMFTLESDGRCSYANPRFYEYTGMSEGEALGPGAARAIHPEDVEDQVRRWRRSAATGELFEMTHRLRAADGSYRWFMSRAEPMRNAEGEIIRWFATSSDIHEYRMANDRQRMLVAELQHRVKNILAVVRSIFTRSIEIDGPTEVGADHFRGRLDALGRTQNVLARTPDGGIDLEEMIRDELTCHGAQNGQQVHISGPPIRVRQKAAEALGLAVHELATNAAKYGALATGTGRIDVEWRVYDGVFGPRLIWKWTETGVRLIDPAPSRVGFGRELIEQGLPYQLGATTALEFSSGGVSCAIELPIGERVAVPNDDDVALEDQ